MKYIVTLVNIITVLSYAHSPEAHRKNSDSLVQITIENLQKHTTFVLDSVENRSINEILKTKINVFKQEYTCVITSYKQRDFTTLLRTCKNCLCYAQELAEEFKLNAAEHHYTGHAHIYNAINCLKTIKNHLHYISLTKNS